MALPSGPTKGYRVNLFDDGAGEYVSDLPVNIKLITGVNGVPFLLPSPWVVSKQGLVTVEMMNVETTNTSLNSHLCFVFAVKKMCKGEAK